MKKLFLMLIILSVTLVGCKSAEEKAQDKYQQAQIAFSSGQIEKGHELVREILDDYSETRTAAAIVSAARLMEAQQKKFQEISDQLSR